MRQCNVMGRHKLGYMSQVQTIKDIATAMTETGMPVKFKVDGVTYATYVENPPIEEQNKWAAYHAEKDRLIAEANAKIQTAAANAAFKNKARMEALRFAPTRKVDTTGDAVPLNGGEISNEAEVIYRWLVKDME